MTRLDSARARVRRAYDIAFEPGSGRIALGSDAQINAAGDLVLFTGIVVEDLDTVGHNKICVAERSGARVVAAGPGSQSHARWSPDGTRVALLSDGMGLGVSQLALLEWPAATFTSTPAIPAVVESL